MAGKRKKTSAGLLVLLLVTTFLIGLVIGMLIVHLADKEEIEEVEKTQLEMKVSEERSVTNVYIPKRERVLGQIAKNPYILENFVLEDGYMAYYDESGKKISHLGLDLSYHNDMVNWDKLASSGVEFVMLRCGYRGYTEGGLVEDEKFKEYASEANRVGIKLGVYFFTQALDEKEAEEEANFVLNLIKDYKIEYPVAIDTEYVNESSARSNTTEIEDEERSKLISIFCERIREEGYYPMIYASENWMRRDLELDLLNQYDFWVAHYQEENDFLYDFTIWQYTEKGSIPGIDEKVDLNISLVDYAEFVPALREAVLSQGDIIEGEGSPTDAVVIENVVEER